MDLQTSSAYKSCSQCERTLDAESFRAFRAGCKDCERSNRLSRYAARSTAWKRPEGIKRCASCSSAKSTLEFRRDPQSQDGLSYRCNACLKAYRANYHAKNRGTENAANRLRANANRDAVRASGREYYRNNRRKCLSSASVRHANNPELSRIRAGRRRAVLRGAIIGDQQVVSAFYAFVKNSGRLLCYWCGAITKRQERHVDHIVALARGGSHSIENLCCSCATCNFSKGSKPQEEFMPSPRSMGDNWKVIT